MTVFPNECPMPLNPGPVFTHHLTDLHCNQENDHYGYLKLISDEMMHVNYGTGEYRDEFPDNGYAVYER